MKFCLMSRLSEVRIELPKSVSRCRVHSVGFHYCGAPLFLQLGDGSTWVLINSLSPSQVAVCRLYLNSHASVGLCLVEDSTHCIRLNLICEGSLVELAYRPASADEVARLHGWLVLPVAHGGAESCCGCVVC